MILFNAMSTKIQILILPSKQDNNKPASFFTRAQNIHFLSIPTNNLKNLYFYPFEQELHQSFRNL